MAAPQATHFDVVVEHKYPVAQFDPGQHAWPLPPQVPQVPFMQTSVLLLQVPAQQAWPVPPQGVQVPAAHT